MNSYLFINNYREECKNEKLTEKDNSQSTTTVAYQIKQFILNRRLIVKKKIQFPINKNDLINEFKIFVNETSTLHKVMFFTSSSKKSGDFSLLNQNALSESLEDNITFEYILGI